MNITRDDVIPTSPTRDRRLPARRLTLKTALRAGSEPAPYQGKRSSGGYVPT